MPEEINGDTEEKAEKTFTQAEVNALMAQTKRDTKAQFADYDDLKKQAETGKSELDKALERIGALEKENVANARKATAATISAEMGVPVGLIHGADEDAMRKSAEAALSWRGEQKAPAKKAPSGAGSLQSGSAGSTPSDPKERAAALLRATRGE